MRSGAVVNTAVVLLIAMNTMIAITESSSRDLTPAVTSPITHEEWKALIATKGVSSIIHTNDEVNTLFLEQKCSKTKSHNTD